MRHPQEIPLSGSFTPASSLSTSIGGAAQDSHSDPEDMHTATDDALAESPSLREVRVVGCAARRSRQRSLEQQPEDATSLRNADRARRPRKNRTWVLVAALVCTVVMVWVAGGLDLVGARAQSRGHVYAQIPVPVVVVSNLVVRAGHYLRDGLS